MPYVIKAVLGSPKYPSGVATVPFPLSRDEYSPCISEVLEPMGIGSAVDQDCFIEDIDSSYDILQCLKNQIVNVDELDYLAKRLDSFCDSEAEAFQAACSAFCCTSIKDLINMTFCCQETTVISDFSKLEEAGKAHYLTIHGGAASAAEVDAVDGKALAEKLIQSGEGKLTPYGLFFRNGMWLEELYQGNGFPPYLWDERQAELELTKPDGSKALIFLPFAELELKRFQQREGIPDIRECKRTLQLYHGQGARIDLNGGIAELEEWNKLCDTLNAMSPHQQQAFAAALEVTGAEDLAQMELLASSLGDFELIPGITDAESYGKYMIQKSGNYDYDESLDCYYNYEAFGEFLMGHEVGQITRRGYLKCEEDSVFLDFFTHESGPIAETHVSKTLRDIIVEHPDATFHILSPDGYFDFTPEQAQALLNGCDAIAHLGAAECFKTVDAQMLLEQFILDENAEGTSINLLTDYTPKIAACDNQVSSDSRDTIQMGRMQF